MRTIAFTCLIFMGMLLPLALFAAPGNDACSNATQLTPGTTCNTTIGDLYKAVSEGITSSCGTTQDVWYYFTLPANASVASITVNMDNGNNATNANTYVEVFNASTCTAISTTNSFGCASVGSTMSLSLTGGNTYYFRVFTTTANTASNASGKYGFTVCVTYASAPANDDCSGAVSLTPAASCSNTTGTLVAAKASASIPQGCFAAGTYYDVWYSFTATQAAHTITLSSLGTSLTVASTQLQVYSGSCGSLTSIACGTAGASTVVVTPTGLISGQTYYVRVAYPSAVLASGTFSICVTSPTLAKVDYSRSYINVTKGTAGGTVDPGDTLEMRFTMVVSSLTVDSLTIYDTLYNTKGLRLVPGSIALRTNEGKIYGNGGAAFTDAFDSDQGWYYANGLDTVIRLNFGTGASQYARGSLSNTSRPSVFNSTCIIMATYRVVVYAGYNSLINFRTGSMTYRDKNSAAMFNITFTKDNLIVYSSPGLCPNATSATNALGAESNGTFGAPSGTAPLARNRGTTPYIGTGYGYMPFNTSGGPNDYYYGITNNTSSKFTTVNTWSKPDANGYRVFNLWDITGDHGGTSTSAGSPACDSTKPVSATNPCGYMLVINSAYRADTAFTYTVNGLCPNTYYEISAWFKNICYKCGCDSTGASSTTTGYIPSAVGDSSGVQPNIAFDVNGVDYYTTGNLKYQGLGSGVNAQANSDGLNVWQKRGFVYLTGNNQSSFTLTLRNNAPGGGGNDWALDDISVKTCLPNMQYSPSTNPTACMNNSITINDTIRSYFNNYNYYKWQRSTDGGSTWSDISGQSGTGTPVWNGSAYEYITTYTVPNSNTTLANKGDKYRVVVATTASNITTGSCQVTDGVSIIDLNVIDCSGVLDTKLIAFNGKLTNNHAQLTWTTTREDKQLYYEVEKSIDGANFTRIGNVKGYLANTETNQYFFTDSSVYTGKVNYRIAMVTPDGKKIYSRIIQFADKSEAFMVLNLANPFESAISFDLSVNTDGKIQVSLLNSAGAIAKQQEFGAVNGVNTISLKNLEGLTPGIYILQIRNNDNIITRKMIKK